jgi:hypothetical protein
MVRGCFRAATISLIGRPILSGPPVEADRRFGRTTVGHLSPGWPSWARLSAMTEDLIRHATARLRDRAMQLRDVVKAPYFKEQLNQVVADMDEIDNFVLAQLKKTTPKPNSNLWLNSAIIRLDMSTAMVKSIEAAVAKYGYDADVIGGD